MEKLPLSQNAEFIFAEARVIHYKGCTKHARTKSSIFFWYGEHRANATRTIHQTASLHVLAGTSIKDNVNWSKFRALRSVKFDNDISAKID